MDVLERIKRGYRAIGPGASRDVLAMFHQEQDDPPEWVVDDSLRRARPARDVVAMDLFAGALPSHWEVIGVDLRMWDYYARKCRLVVGGRFRTRPRGTWEVIPLPFIHIWSVGEDDQVRGVFDYLAGIEVQRREPTCGRGRGWRPAVLAAGARGGAASRGRGRQNASWSPRAREPLAALLAVRAARPPPAARTPRRGWARAGGPARARPRSRPGRAAA